MDLADLRQLLNPEAGFIAMANQDATGALADGDPTNEGDDTTTDTGEIRKDIVLLALGRTAAAIEDVAGTDTNDWRWGRYHRMVQYAEIFDNFGVTDFNNGPFAAPGGMETVNVATPRSLSAPNLNMNSYHGPSMRHVSQVTEDGLRSVNSFPGGERHFRDSPFYNNLVGDYLDNEPFELMLDFADVEAAAVETYDFEPLE